MVLSPCWFDRAYTLLFSFDPAASTPWTNLTSCVTNDNGTERIVTDLNATGSSNFYRIQVTRP